MANIILGAGTSIAEPVVYPTFAIINPVVTVGDDNQIVTPINGFYYVQRGVPIHITTTAQLENGEAISLPPPLAMPFVMYDAMNNPTTKRYAPVIIDEGVVTADITIDEGGAWKISEQFVNEALAEVSQQWRVTMDTITFLVM